MFLADVQPSPRARATDPLTSHEAGHAAEAFVSRQCREVLEGLRSLGGRAGAEQIGAAINMPAYTVRLRTSELEDQGLIRTTGEYRKTATGNRERIWVVIA